MQEQTMQDEPVFFTMKYARAIRVWHWLTFLFITGSMVTVLFASTVFGEEDEADGEKGKPPATAQQQSAATVPAENQTAAPQQQPGGPNRSPEAKIAHRYENKIWDAHKWIGFGVCILLLMRVIIEVGRNKEDRLMTRIHHAINIPVNTATAKDDKQHFVWVKRGYLLFYLFILVMGLTGLVLAFEHTPMLKPIQRPVRQIHSIVQYMIYAYVLLHLIGVIRADLGKQRGIVSAMINGGE